MAPLPALAEIRRAHAAQFEAMPERLRALAPVDAPYPVIVSDAIRALAREVDAATHA